MKNFALLACLLAMPLSADEPFAGTWRVDPSKATSRTPPRRLELKGGTYRCLSCVPPIEVKADGAKHPIKSDFGDGISVKVIDDRTVETVTFAGDRRIVVSTSTVSADGRSRIFEVVQYSPDGTAVKAKYSFERSGPAAAGAHALSGTWTSEKILEMSDTGREFTYKAVPGGLAASDPTGFSYEARFDGKRYPVKGTDGIDEVRIRRIDGRTIEETYWYKGKVTLSNRETVSTDGKTLMIAWSTKNPDGSGTDVAEKR